MPAKENLLGKTFNRLTVIESAPSKNKKTYWKCKCICGNEVIVRADQLKDGNTKSCGCLNTETRAALGKTHIQDIKQQRFGKLTAIRRIENLPSGKGYYWECICDCGNIVQVPIADLKSGNTTSCGCQKESLGECLIANFLITNYIPFETQKGFEDLYNKQNNRKLKFDFYLINENILIEFDGPQHYQNTNFSNMSGRINDQIKNRYCLEHNIKLYRIPYKERLNIPKYQTLDELCKQEYQVLKIDYYNLGLLL